MCSVKADLNTRRFFPSGLAHFTNNCFSKQCIDPHRSLILMVRARRCPPPGDAEGPSPDGRSAAELPVSPERRASSLKAAPVPATRRFQRTGDVWSWGATCKSPHKSAPQKPSGLINLSRAPEGHKFCRASHNCFKTLNVFLLLCGFPAHGRDLCTHLIVSLAEDCSICQNPLWNGAKLS